MTKHFSLQTTLLLIAVILIWGFNWPFVKLALQNAPPLWLGVFRMAAATICLFGYLLVTKKFQLPSKLDIPIILSVGLLQIGLFIFLINIGLLYVSASRSAILVYTTPLWVTPMAVLFFKESLPLLKIIGLLLGIAGIALLFNPTSFNWHDKQAIYGNGLLLLAALSWSIAIVHVRYTTWRLTVLQLMPWQSLISVIFLLLMALIFEGKPSIHWSVQLASIIFYIGIIGSAFAYWAAVELSKRLPAVTTSLCMLGVPVAGIISSCLILGEKITASMIIAVLLLLGGLVCVTMAKP